MLSLLNAIPIATNRRSTCCGRGPVGSRRIALFATPTAAPSGMAASNPSSHLMRSTLEGKDSPGKVKQLCAKAKRPLPEDPSIGPAAAICVYPRLVRVAKEAVGQSGVKVASVATGFPSGQSRLKERLSEIRYAVGAGADEIDMVISRGKLLHGAFRSIFDEIVRCKEACGGAHLKVILETRAADLRYHTHCE